MIRLRNALLHLLLAAASGAGVGSVAVQAQSIAGVDAMPARKLVESVDPAVLAQWGTAAPFLRIRGLPDPTQPDNQPAVDAERAALERLTALGFRPVAFVRWADDSWAGGVREGGGHRLPLDLREAYRRARAYAAAYGGEAHPARGDRRSEMGDGGPGEATPAGDRKPEGGNLKPESRNPTQVSRLSSPPSSLPQVSSLRSQVSSSSQVSALSSQPSALNFPLSFEFDNEPDIDFVLDNPETYAAFLKAGALGVWDAERAKGEGREARGAGGAGARGKSAASSQLPTSSSGLPRYLWRPGVLSVPAVGGRFGAAARRGDLRSADETMGAGADEALSSRLSALSSTGGVPLVVMAPLAMPPGPYFEQLLRNGFLSYTDAFNYHFYGAAADFTGVYRLFEDAVTTASEMEDRSWELGSSHSVLKSDSGKDAEARKGDRVAWENTAGERAVNSSEPRDGLTSERHLPSPISHLRKRQLPVLLTEYGYNRLTGPQSQTVAGRVAQWRWFRDVGRQIEDLRIAGPMAFYLPPYREGGALEFGLTMAPGAEKPEAKGERPEARGPKAENGDLRPETGDLKPETGDLRPETGRSREAKMDGDEPVPEQSGGMSRNGHSSGARDTNLKLESGDLKPETGDLKPETGRSREAKMGGDEPVPEQSGGMSRSGHSSGARDTNLKHEGSNQIQLSSSPQVSGLKSQLSFSPQVSALKSQVSSSLQVSALKSQVSSPPQVSSSPQVSGLELQASEFTAGGLTFIADDFAEDTDHGGHSGPISHLPSPISGAAKAAPWMRWIGADIGGNEASPALAWLIQEGIDHPYTPRNWTVSVAEPSPVVIDFVAGASLEQFKRYSGYVASETVADASEGTGDLVLYNFSDTPQRGRLEVSPRNLVVDPGALEREFELAPMARVTVPVRLRVPADRFIRHDWSVRFVPAEPGGPVSVFSTAMYPNLAGMSEETVARLDAASAGEGRTGRNRATLAERRIEPGEAATQPVPGSRWRVTAGDAVSEDGPERWIFEVAPFAGDSIPAVAELPLPDDFSFPPDGLLSLRFRLVEPTGTVTGRFFHIYFRTANGNLYGVNPWSWATGEWTPYLEARDNYTLMFDGRANPPWRFRDNRIVSLVFMIWRRGVPMKVEIEDARIVHLLRPEG